MIPPHPTRPFEADDDIIAIPVAGSSPMTVARPGLAGPDAEAWIARAQAACVLLGEIAAALPTHDIAGPPRIFDLAGLSGDDLRLVSEVLGEGEVTGTVFAPGETRIRESVMAGLWRVTDADHDRVEIADIPTAVRIAAEAGIADLTIPAGAERNLPEGAMNVLPLLTEIGARMEDWRPGMDNHVISFDLFPMSPVDMSVLQRVLGTGPVALSSLGYGTCRVTATGHRHVWSVQYLNARDAVVMDSLEIGGVPVAVRAATEDLEDSARRMADILEAYL